MKGFLLLCGIKGKRFNVLVESVVARIVKESEHFGSRVLGMYVGIEHESECPCVCRV